MRMARTDEEDGRFKVVGLRPGIWHVIARGRAGVNEAVWEDPFVEVKPGSVETVKISTTEFSCPVTNN